MQLILVNNIQGPVVGFINGPAGLIHLGHNICNVFDLQHRSGDSEVKFLQAATDLSLLQVEQIVADAEMAYCPWDDDRP